MKKLRKIIDKHWKIIILLLVVMALGFRFWQLGSLPSSLNRDEAALGYNAILLKEKGLDEWGRTWPIILESFGDYKLIGYPATLVATFSTFGVSDWAVRLPSLIGGLLLVIATWFWADTLKLKTKTKYLLVLLVSTTPIFFFYSRIGYEANLALFYLVAGLLLLSKSSSSTAWNWLKSGVGGALILLSALTYNTPLLLLPFFIPLLYLSANKKKARFWLNSGIILSIFVGVVATLWPVLSQKSGITIFTDLTVWTNWINFRESLPIVLQSTLGHRFVFWFWLMTRNWLLSFSPKFLVTAGGTHPWHQLPGWGHLLWPTYLLGLWGMLTTVWLAIKQCLKLPLRLRSLLKVKLSPELKLKLGLLITMFLSLAPAVVTVDAPHATRSLLFIYLWVIFAGIGFEALAKSLAKTGLLEAKERLSSMASRLLKVGTLNLLSLIILLQVVIFAFYLRDYFYQYPQHQALIFQTGFEQVIHQVDKEYPTDSVAVVDPGGYQYILLAWYQKTNPDQYLKTNIRQLPDRIGLEYGEQVGRYHFIVDEGDRSDKEKVLIYWDDGRNLDGDKSLDGNKPGSVGWKIKQF